MTFNMSGILGSGQSTEIDTFVNPCINLMHILLMFTDVRFKTQKEKMLLRVTLLGSSRNSNLDLPTSKVHALNPFIRESLLILNKKDSNEIV